MESASTERRYAESLFEAAARDVRTERASSEWLPLAFVAVVILAAPGGPSGVGLATLAGALVLQDIAQWVGMKLMNEPDKTLLVLPFLRTSLPEGGRPVAYKRGILFLLGPLPCGVLAFWLAIAKWTTGIPELGSAALTAAILGGFGLLPLAQSDGGRLLELTVFCRHPIAEAIFVVLTCAASVAVGVALEAWFIVGIGAIGLVALPWRLRSAQAARRLRETAPELPARPADLDEDAMRALFESALPSLGTTTAFPAPTATPGVAKSMAATMRGILHRAVTTPPSVRASALLLVGYMVGFAGVVVAFVLAALASR